MTAMASLLARAEEEKEGERAVFALPRGGGPPRSGEGTDESKEYYTCRCSAGC